MFLPEDLAAGGALLGLDFFSTATPDPTVVARRVTGLLGLGAAAAEAEAEVSLLRCDSDLALALFRNSLEGIVTGGGDFLALCVPVAGEAAVAACSSVDLGLASRSSLEVETALLPAVLLRCCGLRLFGWYCRPADSGAVGMRSVLRLCALAVRGVIAKPPSVPSFPSPVQIIQNNAVREKERGGCGVM